MFRRAIWEKLGRRRFRKLDLLYHGKPTGKYIIEGNISLAHAKRFLREHVNCLRCGGWQRKGEK